VWRLNRFGVEGIGHADPVTEGVDPAFSARKCRGAAGTGLSVNRDRTRPGMGSGRWLGVQRLRWRVDVYVQSVCSVGTVPTLTRYGIWFTG
jgi:hypothetical protein